MEVNSMQVDLHDPKKRLTSKDAELPLTPVASPGSAAEESAMSAANSDAPAEQSAEQGGPFGDLSPSEAAKRSHAPSSARHNPAEQDDAAIIRKLRQKAAKGDVPAARELREWQDRDADSDATGDEWMALATPQERAYALSLHRHIRARKLGQAEGEWTPSASSAGDTGR
jgi:hypothetical protein